MNGNFMDGNNFYGNGFGTSYGYSPQPQAQPVFNQLLTADEVARLQKNPNLFSTKLTEDEYLRAVCTHKDHANHITLEKLPNGKHRCAICQAEFYLIDLNTSKEEIEAMCNSFYDLMQSIKTYYGNAPEALRDFYLMIGFLPKIRHLWNVAKTYFDKVTGNYGGLSMNNDQSGFSTLANIFGNGAMANAIPGIGGYGGGVGYYGQPPMNPWYQGAPVPPSAMQTPGYGVPPQGQVPPAQANPNMYGPQNPVAQNPVYGYNPMYGPGPAPTVSVNPMQSPNPIGYVDNPQRDFTQANTQQTPVSPTQPPMPPVPQPQNPNIENKAEVSKTFAG